MAVAFKEWQVVCDALASGRQSIVLRKGGIHEGREGFSFAHDSFLLFPTKFHAKTEQIRDGDFTPEKEWQEGDTFSITHYAKALFAVTLTDWDKVKKLHPHHVYTDQTLKDRFDWAGKGMRAGSIHLAFVRVCAFVTPLEITYEKRFGGCRSWLELPGTEIPSSVEPVLKAAAFNAIQEDIKAIAGLS